MYADKMEHMRDCDSCERGYCPDCELQSEIDSLEQQLELCRGREQFYKEELKLWKEQALKEVENE
jgi:hypothetical protein